MMSRRSSPSERCELLEAGDDPDAPVFGYFFSQPMTAPRYAELMWAFHIDSASRGKPSRFKAEEQRTIIFDLVEAFIDAGQPMTPAMQGLLAVALRLPLTFLKKREGLGFLSPLDGRGRRAADQMNRKLVLLADGRQLAMEGKKPAVSSVAKLIQKKRGLKKPVHRDSIRTWRKKPHYDVDALNFFKRKSEGLSPDADVLDDTIAHERSSRVIGPSKRLSERLDLLASSAPTWQK
jgi:hypothetical protein